MYYSLKWSKSVYNSHYVISSDDLIHNSCLQYIHKYILLKGRISHNKIRIRAARYHPAVRVNSVVDNVFYYNTYFSVIERSTSTRVNFNYYQQSNTRSDSQSNIIHFYRVHHCNLYRSLYKTEKINTSLLVPLCRIIPHQIHVWNSLWCTNQRLKTSETK